MIAMKNLDTAYVRHKLRLKKAGAQKRGIYFSLHWLSMYNMMRAERCYYTGLPLCPGARPMHQPTATSFTIDRIDNSKGYVKGNVVACCRAFNELKSYAERAGLAITKEIIDLLKEACTYLYTMRVDVLNRMAIDMLRTYNEKFSIFFRKPA